MQEGNSFGVWQGQLRIFSGCYFTVRMVIGSFRTCDTCRERLWHRRMHAHSDTRKLEHSRQNLGNYIVHDCLVSSVFSLGLAVEIVPITNT